MIRAIPSCDQVFLVWAVTEMIPGCAGFAVFREVEGEAAQPLDTWVGFAGDAVPPAGTHRPSTEWPIQKTSWTDYLAPQTGRVRYGYAPVVRNGDILSAAVAADCIWSDWVSLDQGEAPITAWFNRGTISAQWLARALGDATAPAQHLANLIDTVGDPIRNFLAGRARARLVSHLETVRDDPSRHLYAALFELNDRELVGLLKSIGPRAHVVLGNSDGTNSNNQKSTDVSAAALKSSNVDIVRRPIAPGRFAHNKFVVFHDSSGAPERVWTGSINWTETGVCTQNSNGLDIKDPGAAGAFQTHWTALYKAGIKKIVEASSHSFSLAIGGQAAKCDLWFTPVAKTVDLAEARALINGAQQGILFLMLNPGPAGLLGPIIERLSSLGADHNADLYIRGVLNNFPSRTEGKGSPADTISLLTSEGTRQNFTDKDLAGVLKPAGIGEAADWWAKELRNTGKFMVAVHSKVIVIDPASDNPIVLTGSHNFSNRASRDNDDNLVIVRGAGNIALSYAVNVIGIYNEYRWRAWRNTKTGMRDHGLKKDDVWLSSRINRDWLKRETAFWVPPQTGAPPGMGNANEGGASA